MSGAYRFQRSGKWYVEKDGQKHRLKHKYITDLPEILWDEKTGWWEYGEHRGRTMSGEELIYECEAARLSLTAYQAKARFRALESKARKQEWATRSSADKKRVLPVTEAYEPSAPLRERFNWKDSAGYQQYLLSSWWKYRRLLKLQKVGLQCEECGHDHGLHVHHLSYERVWRERDGDLQVLCQYCHAKKHPDKIKRSA